MTQTIYQLKVSLKNFKPVIWRSIQVRSDTLLQDLHKIIQTTMGWTNSHLHQFIKGEKSYQKRTDEIDFWDDRRDVDYKDTPISALLKKEKDQIIYEYDFGDGWEHDIILMKILPVDDKLAYPVCLAGKMGCPPEDCGGPWGYSNMLEILRQPDHEEYDSYLDWLGSEFDPEYFDRNEVNELLQQDNFGCIDLF